MNLGGIFPKIISSIQRQIKKDPALKKFVQHNRKTWKKWKPESVEGEILVDFFPIFGPYIGREYGLNILAKEKNASITAFSSKPFLDLKLKTLYRSFNTNKFLRIKFSKKMQAEASKIAQAAWPTLQDKTAFLDFELDGCNIGMDIYETYLRECHQPTLNFNDKNLKEIFLKGICTHLFWKNYYETHEVKALFTSHNCYIEYNIPIRVALKHSTPIYLVDSTGAHRLIDLAGPYNDFSQYKKYFESLTAGEQEAGIAWAKSRLDLRLKGEAGVDMPYSTLSAFGASTSERLLKKSENIKVLICSHCFFDNPHAYSKILFPDFYEWLSFLNKIAAETKYDWYLKTHPDYLPGTIETINEILGKDSKIKILPANASHRQLAEEGLDYALTVYGTVGIEYPLLGVQVISLGYNPRISFDFNFSPQTLSEYGAILRNLSNRPTKDLISREIYKAYFIFYQYVRVDDLIFPSFRELLAELQGTQLLNSEAYLYFLKRFSASQHNKSISRIQNFFHSSESHLYALERKK